MAEGFPTLVMTEGDLLEDEIEVVFRFDNSGVDSNVSSIQETLETFLEAARGGAFPSKEAFPEQSQLILLNSPHGSNNLVRVLVKCVNIDSRCFQLLRNMTGRLIIEGIHVNQISVKILGRSVDTTLAAIPDVYNMYQVYPEPSRRLTFTVEWLGTSFSKSRRCLVQCTRTLEPHNMADIEPRVAAWGRLLESGAYAMPIGFPDEVDVAGIDVSQFDENTIEVAISHFKASEAAWCTLLHLLDVVSRQSIPLEKISVE